MSCNEWEAGEIVIPAKEWVRFRTELLKDWNRYQQTLFEDAKRAYPIARAAVKGVGGREHESAVLDALVREFRGQDDRIDEIERLIRDKRWDEERKCSVCKLHAPRKKDLPLVATTKDAVIDFEETRVTFTNKTRTVKWVVGENNHACERAHQHWFAKRLFAALGRVGWTRGSGGKIVGNDEYNRQSCAEGGGANYVTYKFGPEAKKATRLDRSRCDY